MKDDQSKDERDTLARIDVRAELDKLDGMLSELKILYEQYFAGVFTQPPDKQHQELKRQIRRLRKAPFKASEMQFRLKALEHRYGTLHTYWQRVLRERESGTYIKDVFKAEMRERIAAEEAHAQTAGGKAEGHMKSLFNSYKSALEQHTGKKHELNFDAFRDSLLQRAKDLREKHGFKKLSFKVVVKDGRVTVQARGRE